jgi:hypothetical protein
MIIFNLAAILIVLLAALFSIPFIIIYAFGGMSEKMLVICISWMILVASFVGKYSGTDGRIFFIPMWLLSIPIPFIFTYATYKWTGIGVTFAIFIGFMSLMVLLLYYAENKRFKKLHSEKIEFPDHAADPEAYWSAVKDKFFSPSFIKMSPEIARFNIRVAEALERSNVALTTLEIYKQEMSKVGSKRTTNKVNPTAEKNLMAEIDAHLETIQQRNKFKQEIKM